MSEATRDVIVVGAGPAGSTLATLLARRGWDVLVLDAARFPRDKVCGDSVSPEGWRCLASVGALERVSRLTPRPLHGMRLVSPNGTSFEGRYRGRAGFALRRVDLDAALVATARASGAEIREGVRASSIEAGAGLLCASGEGLARLRARLVCGADGRRSVVARQLGLLREHPSLRRFAVRGYWEGAEGLDDLGEMHVAAGGYCGLAPLARDRANVTLVLPMGEMAAAAGDLEAFYRERLRRQWPRVAERLARARLLEAPRAIGPLALESRGVTAPGFLVLGDAAGFYDPFTGEGVTLALRSAILAAQTIDDALRASRIGSPVVPLHVPEYGRMRESATRDKFRFNRMLQAVVSRPAVADALAGRLARRPDLADLLVGVAGDFVPARQAFSAAFVFDLLLRT